MDLSMLQADVEKLIVQFVRKRTHDVVMTASRTESSSQSLLAACEPQSELAELLAKEDSRVGNLELEVQLYREFDELVDETVKAADAVQALVALRLR